MKSSPVPSFYLYGEPHRLVDDRFVHVEALDDRTRPSEWTIRPHVHTDLNHIFHVESGGGSMRADAEIIPFLAPCLLLVPAGTVHGFAWNLESTGSVLTMASSYLAEILVRDPDLAGVFTAPGSVSCDDVSEDIAARLMRLSLELGWAAPGYRAAAEQDLLGILVMILRRQRPRTDVPEPGPKAALVARLRERIDKRFRLRESVQAHAHALGVSERRLRAACATAAHQSPAEMLDQRAVLEAKRSLLYGNLSVAEVGYALGFTDPAYFSRFFTRHAGSSPAAFRKGGRAPEQ
ncbi:MAG TPA: helix-turn-helix domain-containing protein [Sphingobium sp.]